MRRYVSQNLSSATATGYSSLTECVLVYKPKSQRGVDDFFLLQVRKARIADVARPEHITEQAIMVPVQEVRPGFVNWRESCTELVGRLSTIVAHAHASYDTLHQALTCPLCKHPLDQGPFMYV